MATKTERRTGPSSGRAAYSREITKNHPGEDLFRDGPASLDLAKPDPARNGATRLMNDERRSLPSAHTQICRGGDSSEQILQTSELEQGGVDMPTSTAVI
jgi:hypothetical protein